VEISLKIWIHTWELVAVAVAAAAAVVAAAAALAVGRVLNFQTKINFRCNPVTKA